MTELLRKARAEGWHDHINSGNDEAAVRAGYVYSENYARRAVDFFPTFLRHTIGRWVNQPFVLQPWQAEIISSVFGWVHRETRCRRYRTAHIEVAKKNGKSTLAAGVGLLLFRGDGENAAQVFSAATKRDQAAIVHDEAVRMCRRSPIGRNVKIHATTRIISHEATASRYAVISRDAAGEEGKNISGLICDELHRWTDRDFWYSLRYAGAGREQPLYFLISTAGIWNQAALSWELHDYAVRVAADEIEDIATYVKIWAADPAVADTDDITLPEVHRAANPSYGVTIDPAEISKAAADAIARPTERLPFLRYRLNIWTQQAEHFIDMPRWLACAGELPDLEGRRCYGGLDLASTQDLCALAWIFPPADDTEEPWILRVRGYVPFSRAAIRESTEKVPYATWGREGHLVLTKPGDTTNYEWIFADILADCQKYDVQSLAVDPFQADYFIQRLRALGVEIHEFTQTMAHYSEPTRQFAKLYLDGKLLHEGNPALDWCARNVIPYEDGKGNMMPHKGLSTAKGRSPEKIDMFVVAVMAYGLALLKEGDELDATCEIL